MTNKLLLLACLFTAAATGCSKSKSAGVGVPECDQYLEKVAACGKKVGGQTGESLERSTKMFADAWRDNAKDDSMKDQLPKTCSDALAAAKKTLPNCDW